ncbi:MAG: transglutaminase domain-containing protein [Lysinibacillus sp.]|nr:transglutaminase domain-containing protein [Lysinibacillus sp.]
MKEQTFKTIELALYYIVIFFILREWLLPIMMLTGTGYLEFILLFIALCLAISLVGLHVSISWIIKIVYIAWFIVYVYSEFSIFTLKGVAFLYDELIYNFALIFQGDFLYVTNAFQSILFFILIWMFIYLIHHWLTVRMNVFFFLVLTIFFIGVLDTFTEYDGTIAIVKVVLLGLMMMVLLFIKRMQLQIGVSFKFDKYLKITLPVLFTIFLVGFVAAILPKATPQWPDPVPYIKAIGQGDGLGGRVLKVGYDEDDSMLGGSFIGDDTVVFMVHSSKKQYWRVETKDVYTSKGWETSEVGEAFLYKSGDSIHHSLPIGPVENREFAHVESMYPYDFIIQPYGTTSVYVSPELADDALFAMNHQTEKLSTYLQNEKTVLDFYHIEYSTPEYLYSDLTSTIEQPIDPAIRDRYLQLPDTLPQRVIDLAKEIVDGKENDYDKARAIESYFGLNGFRYETEGVPVPGVDQDYVDQFLFESKIGYCDNFSTSMVVLLRAVGIPARWVKGFTGGELVASGELNTYQITNNDAHSWVEAYIPKVGWVPFEPTIGFSTNRSINYDYETDAYQDEMLTVDEETEPETKINEREEITTGNNEQLFVGLFDKLKQYRFLFSYVLIGLFVLGILLFILRNKWMPKVYVKWLKRQQLNESTFESLYLKLLKMLELKGLKRQEGQTLASFAKEVDEKFLSQHMSIITKAYESYLYGQSTKLDYNKLKESLEYLINRCSS